VVLAARDAEGAALGFVTVCERARSFELGISRVRADADDAQYAGRGWREHLYRDAIMALQEALQPMELAA
jgi:hypothetical protein